MDTEISHQSWGGRLMSSIKGVLFGIVLFLGSFVLLSWNEGRAVKTYRMLHEVRRETTSISAETVSDLHEGRPVHLTGTAQTEEVLTDPRFEVSANAIHLRRVVEMYQWEEEKETRTEKKAGGGTRKTVSYSYRKVWSDRVIPSAGFHRPSGHENPGAMPYESWRDRADRVTLGSFRLSPELIGSVDFYERLDPRDATLPEGFRISDQTLYRGASPSSPEIGDVRIRFEQVPPLTLSVIAAQTGATLSPWPTSGGKRYWRVQPGQVGLEAMMDAAESEARLLTWILRAAGWGVMALGLGLVLKPISVVGDVIPFLGNLAESGISLVAGLVSLALTLLTIGVAWIAVRPLIGVPLVLVAALLLAARLVKSRSALPDTRTGKSTTDARHST